MHNYFCDIEQLKNFRKDDSHADHANHATTTPELLSYKGTVQKMIPADHANHVLTIFS